MAVLRSLVSWIIGDVVVRSPDECGAYRDERNFSYDDWGGGVEPVTIAGPYIWFMIFDRTGKCLIGPHYLYHILADIRAHARSYIRIYSGVFSNFFSGIRMCEGGGFNFFKNIITIIRSFVYSTRINMVANNITINIRELRLQNCIIRILKRSFVITFCHCNNL